MLKDIKIKVGRNQIREAIQELIDSNLDSSVRNEALLLLSRYNELKSESDKGIVSYENFKVERNRIVNSLLNLIVILDKIGEKEKEDQKRTPVVNSQDQKEEIKVSSPLQASNKIGLNQKKESGVTNKINILDETGSNTNDYIQEVIMATMFIVYSKFSGIVEFHTDKLKNDKQ